MIITFPHMGDMSIVLNALFTNLGRTVQMPPPISRHTLELGIKHSPETVCLPFKITLGNFIEALEAGADTIVTCGGVGPCRLGFYAEVQRGILQELGYDFDMIVCEPTIMGTLQNVNRVAAGKSLWAIYQSFRLALAKLYALDELRRQTYHLRPRENTFGGADRLWQQAQEAIDSARNVQDIKVITETTKTKLADLCLNPDVVPLRIGVVGEIYVMLEAFINLDLDRKLGAMGVEVYKTMYLSDYVNGHLLRKSKYLDSFRQLASLAKPYLGHYVGGHGLKSIAHTLDMGNQGFDGIVHVFPFTCMPEVVAKNILPKASNDSDIPVLSIAFDEQSGEAGIITRLEAFVDLLRYRRKLSQP